MTTTTTGPDYVSDALATVREQVEAGNHAGALTTLLGVWRATRATGIANAIDAVSKEVTQHEPPIVAVGKISERQMWGDTFNLRKPQAYVRLLEALPFNSHAPERVVQIARLDSDPRITSFAGLWLTTKPPLTSQNRVPFYAKLFTILEKNEDTRINPTLVQVTSSAERPRTVRRIGLKNWKPLVALTARLAQVESNERKGDRSPTLSSDDLATLQRIESLLVTARPTNVTGSAATMTNPKELFARVYADPDDDEARAVLGDLLQQQNDPRGELIALQLARHSTNKPKSPRERELETTWGRVWLGPLAPLVVKEKDGVVYERGFPARCRLAYKNSLEESTAQLFPHEEWSTITHIDVRSRASGPDLIALLTSPVARAVRHVTGISSDALGLLLERKVPLPWKTLGVVGWSLAAIEPLLDGPRDVFLDVRRLVTEVAATSIKRQEVLGIIEKWPAVQDLAIGIDDADIARTIRSPTINRLDHLVLKGRGYEVDLLPKIKPSRVHFILESLWGETGALITNIVRSLAGSRSEGENRFDHVHVTMKGSRATLVDNILAHGRYEKIDISELRLIAKGASMTLTFFKEKIT